MAAYQEKHPGRPASPPGQLWEGAVNHALCWATGNMGSGAFDIGAIPTKQTNNNHKTKPSQTKSTGVGKMTHHRRGWGIDCRGVSWVRSKPLVRKGQGDGNYRLARGGNSGASRHQLLLSPATHILFLSNTLSWGQCPSKSGAGSSPQVSCQRGTQTSVYWNSLTDRTRGGPEMKL